MANPFLGEISMFGGNFAPRGWVFCNGSLLMIASNTALFSILGTTYGGDGRTTFGVPNLQGRVAMHAGQGPGLSNRVLGQVGGTTQETIDSVSKIGSHTHSASMHANTGAVDTTNPVGNVPASVNAYTANAADVDMNAGTIELADTGALGSVQAHTNLMPIQAVSFIIAVVGTFPSRN
jgi:microcystin-dependent protein